MSEYQFYEFIALDKALDKKDMEAVGQVSSRAEVSPNRFCVVYNYGDFRGDVNEFMARYFDAMVYVSNWGTRRFMMRLPSDLVDLPLLKGYCTSDRASMNMTDQFMVLDFSTCPEDYGGGWEEGEGWLPELLPLRAELISGDLRVLYLTWLLSAQCGEVDEAAQEPPLPPGLKNLSAAQECLIEFLRLDPELVAVAAELSEAQQELPYDIDPWIAALPEAEKNDLLIQLVKGQDPQLGARLLKRYRSSIKSVADVSPGRTASELLHATQERHEAREREENRCKAKARADYLDGLALREEAVWRQVEELVEMRQAKPYGSAVELLKDLRELDRNRDNISWFQRRLSDLCGRHNKKRGFIDRLKKAGLQ